MSSCDLYLRPELDGQDPFGMNTKKDNFCLMTLIVKCKAVYTLTQNYQSVNFFFLVRLIFTMFPDELKRRSDAAELTGIAKHFLTNCERCGRHRAFNFHQFKISFAPVLKGIAKKWVEKSTEFCSGGGVITKNHL
jgi:hypothetical protein